MRTLRTLRTLRTPPTLRTPRARSFLAPIVATALLVLASAPGSGCASTPGKVDRKQLKTLRADAAGIQPGTPRDDALATLERANSVRLSSALLDGVAIEEWKVEAFDDSGSGRDLFVTFLYFADGKLVDQSDRRIDYRANEPLRRQWTTRPGPKG